MHVILQERFRERLREALDTRGWTQSDLARRMHVAPQYVNAYLSGVRCPGLDVVQRFSEALGIPDPIDLLNVPAAAGKI